MIRVARPDDLPVLREIERAAGSAFGDFGMAAIANDDPLTEELLAVFQRDGRAWVVADSDDQPVGYVLVSRVDGNGHVDQVSVHPTHSRQGLGRALLEEAEAWAEKCGLPALTLTTFVHVPWNAPYYERLGFRTLHADETGEGLRAVEDHERALGLALWPRVSMQRAVRRTPR